MTPDTLWACEQLIQRAFPSGTFGRVLEIGSRDINGSVRGAIEPFATEYIGIDIAEGPGVDRIMSVHEIIGHFGSEAFDFVISTETLEHLERWQVAIWQMKATTKVDGRILLTTRMPGFPYHAQWGEDYWRFTPGDMAAAFADCNPLWIDYDDSDRGVYVMATRNLSGKPTMPSGGAFRVIASEALEF